jgi:hypothetical protein
MSELDKYTQVSEEEPDYNKLAMGSNALIAHRLVAGTHWFGLVMYDGTYHPIMKAAPIPELGWVLDYPLNSSVWRQDQSRAFNTPNCVEILQKVQDSWFRATNGQKIVWLKTSRQLALKLDSMAIKSVEHFLVPDQESPVRGIGRETVVLDDANHFLQAAPRVLPAWGPAKLTPHRAFPTGTTKPADKPCHEPGGYKPWMPNFLKEFELFLTLLPRLKLVHDVIRKTGDGLLLDVRDGEYEFHTQVFEREAKDHVLVFRALREDYGDWCAAQANARKK